MEKYRANELLHARWAMLAAAGIIIPEGLQVCPDTLVRAPTALPLAAKHSVTGVSLGKTCLCKQPGHPHKHAQLLRHVTAHV